MSFLKKVKLVLASQEEDGEEGRRLSPCRMETCRRAGTLHVVVRQEPSAHEVFIGLGKPGICSHFEGIQVNSESDSMDL